MKPIKLKELLRTAKDPATQRIVIDEGLWFDAPLFEGVVKDVDKTNIDFSSIAVELQQAYNNGKGDDNHDHNCTKHQQLPHTSVLW